MRKKDLASWSIIAVAITLLGSPNWMNAASAPKEKPKANDGDAIVGTWKIETIENGLGGRTIDEMERMVFTKDGKLKVTGRPKGDMRDTEGKYTLDPSAKPKTIDLSGGEGRKPALGIYELDGDTLKLCIAEGPERSRPAEMKPNGKYVSVVKLKRVNEEKKDKN